VAEWCFGLREKERKVGRLGVSKEEEDIYLQGKDLR
jgi:hypothetical protein